MAALIWRQYADRSPFWITPELKVAFQYFEKAFVFPSCTSVSMGAEAAPSENGIRRQDG